MNDPLLTPQRYTRIRELFLQVCELDPLERSAILDSACADDGDLRGEVESLLREDSHASGIVGEHQQRRNTVSALARSASMTPLESLPCQFGRYRLLRVIGEGGMGTVYEAQQLHPHRMVALKLLRPGLITTAMLRRFDYEAHVLGLLQHPGIAQIFEAGTADRGQGEQPFFAMELVRGQPLLKYAAEHTLSVRQKLELMARICDAVQHAHTKGVVHRDLKPNNILIDESGQPKILDFGVARATDCDIQTTTLHTQVGQLVGTLAYMSPEQAGGNPDEVDTRSDVYSLGVICYELLSGRLPLDLARKPLHEAVRMIREQDPPRLGALDRALRGDIETIVAKAIEKEPGRRYQMAAEMAADVGRFLSDKPLIATPVTLAYQARKFVHRHQAACIAVTICVVALVLGIVGTTYGLLHALIERNNAEEAQHIAEIERSKAQDAADLAQAQGRKAEAVTTFLQDILSAGEPGAPTPIDLSAHDLLVTASDRLEAETPEQWDVEAALRYALGTSFLALSDTTTAGPHLSRAYQLRSQFLGDSHPDTIEVAHALCWQDMTNGLFEAAVTRANETVERAVQALGHSHPQTQQAVYYAAMAQLIAGDYVAGRDGLLKALRFQEEHGNRDVNQKLKTIAPLGFAYLQLGDFENAAIWCERAAKGFAEHFGERHPFTLVAMDRVASVVAHQGRPDEAVAIRQRTLAIRRERLGPDNRNTLQSMSALAKALRIAGQMDEAERAGREASTMLHNSLGPDHPEAMQAQCELGAILSIQRQFKEANDLLEDCLERQTRVLGEDHLETMTTLNNLAGSYRRAGQPDRAEQLLRRSFSIYERKLGLEHPRTQTSLHNLCLVLRDLQRWSETEALCRRLVDVRLSLLGEANSKTRESVAILVDVLRAGGNPAEALEWSERVTADSPDAESGKLPLDPFRMQKAECLLDLDRDGEAEQILNSLLQPLDLESTASHPLVRHALELLVRTYERTGRPEQAALYASFLKK